MPDDRIPVVPLIEEIHRLDDQLEQSTEEKVQMLEQLLSFRARIEAVERESRERSVQLHALLKELQ